MNRSPSLAHKERGTHDRAHCPCDGHADEHASFEIKQGDNGRPVFICRAGCPQNEVLAALRERGLWPKNGSTASPARNASALNRKPPKTYPTFEAATAAIETQIRRDHPDAQFVKYWPYPGDTFRCARFQWEDEKTYRPFRRVEDGWQIGDLPGDLPLYASDQLGNAHRIFVHEGEKCCDAGLSIGLISVSPAHGAQSPDRTDWSPLAGREVVILPDNDDPGKRFAETIARLVTSLDPPATAKIVQLPELKSGGDIVDFVRAGNSSDQELRDRINQLADEAPQYASATQSASKNDEAKTKGEEKRARHVASFEPFRPFPVNVLPDAIARFVHETSDAVGCDAALVGLPVLSVLAATIGTTRSIELKSSWREYAIVWTCTIGRSGGLKSPAMDAAVEPLHRAQLLKLRDHQIAVEEYETKLLHHERDYAAWKTSKIDEEPPKKPTAPSAIRYVVADTTIEALVPIIEVNQRGPLVARDELRGWFGGFNQYKSGQGSDVAAWLELWRGGTLIVDRKGNRKTVHIARAAASVCGGIQPGVLASIASADYLDSGLIPRVLWAHPPEKVKKWTNRVPRRATLTAYEGVIRNLLNLQHVESEYGPEPVHLPLTAEARGIWVLWYDKHARRIADAPTDHLAAALSKTEAYAARFSLIFALVVHSGATVISPEAIERGTQLADWFAHELGRVYQLFDESDDDRDRRKLTELIQRKGGSVTPRELTRSSSQFDKATDAEAALNKLVTAGIARWEHAPSTPKGGKPSKRLVLIDAIANDNTPPGAPVSKAIVSVNGVSAQGNTLGRATRDTPSRANSSGVTTVDNSLSGRVSTDPLPFDSPHAPIEGSETILNTSDTTDTDNTHAGAPVSGGIVSAGEENDRSDANAEEEATWTAYPSSKTPAPPASRSLPGVTGSSSTVPADWRPWPSRSSNPSPRSCPS